MALNFRRVTPKRLTLGDVSRLSAGQRSHEGRGAPARGGFLPEGEAALGTLAKSHSHIRVQRFYKQAAARVLLPMERIHNCLRAVTAGRANVGVWMSNEHQRAHYKNLQTCGSVWHCPVCAAKISETRRAELEAAIAVHKASGGEVLLLTLTNSHHKRDRLADLLEGQTKALTLFRGGKKAVALFKGMGVVGMVRAWEVTHGASGWHPHFHILVFLARPLDDLAGWRDCLARRWQNCCKAARLPLPDLIHGCDLQDGSYAARYASKWGLPEEMTKGHIKKGREGGKTPFDLLGEFAETGDMEPARLFQEYAICFKGKRQLVWSPGLKARLKIEERTDDQVAAGGDEGAFLLGLLDLEQWRTIVHSDQRAKVLEVAESQGWAAVLAFVSALPPPPPKPDSPLQATSRRRNRHSKAI